LQFLFDAIEKNPGIKMRYVNTKQQCADIMTKASFSERQFQHLSNLINIGPKPKPTESDTTVGKVANTVKRGLVAISLLQRAPRDRVPSPTGVLSPAGVVLRRPHYGFKTPPSTRTTHALAPHRNLTDPHQPPRVVETARYEHCHCELSYPFTVTGLLTVTKLLNRRAYVREQGAYLMVLCLFLGLLAMLAPTVGATVITRAYIGETRLPTSTLQADIIIYNHNFTHDITRQAMSYVGEHLAYNRKQIQSGGMLE